MVNPLKELLYLSGLQSLVNAKDIELGYNIDGKKKFNIIFEHSNSKRNVNLENSNIEVFSSSPSLFQATNNTLMFFDLPKTIEEYLSGSLYNPDVPSVDLIARFFRNTVTSFLSGFGIQLPVIYPLPQNKPLLFLSHDVDLLRYSKKYDLFRFGKLKRLSDYFALFNLKYDRYWNIDRIINWERENKLKSTFFFITAKRDKHAKRYSLREATSTIKLLQHNGYEIGLHLPDFDKINGKVVKREYGKLTRYADITGMRKHYLAENFYDYIESIQNSPVKYDSSAGYRDRIGFKIGTSYPVWYGDILEIPLFLMDSAYINSKQKNQKNLFDFFHSTGGICSILFHNHILAPEHAKWWNNIRELTENLHYRINNSMTGKEIYRWRKQIDSLSVSLINRKVIINTNKSYSDFPITVEYKNRKFNFYAMEVKNEKVIN